MGKKTKLICFNVTIILVFISFILYRYRIDNVTEAGRFFAAIGKGRQLRAILASGALYVYGWLLISVWETKENIYLKALVSYPVALAVWCISSACILISGIPYLLITAVIIMLIILLSGIVINKGSIDVKGKSLVDAGILFGLFLAVTAFLSSGFPNSYMTHDSYYYILEWGKLLAKTGGITSIQNQMVFDTGLFPATVAALADFCGIENLFTFHHCLVACFWGIFAYICYNGLQIEKKNVRFCFAVCIMLFTYMLPPVHFESGLLLSHTYQMALLIPYILLLWKDRNQENISRSDKAALILCTFAFTLLRSDAPITFCIILFCFITCGFKDMKVIVGLACSSMAFFIIYHIKIRLVCRESLGGSLLQGPSIAMILAAFVFVILYGILMKKFSDKWLFRYAEPVSYVLLALLNVALWGVFKELYVENFKIIYQNATLIHQLWGVTFWILVLMLVYLFMGKEKTDPIPMISVFVIIIGADMGVLRTLVGVGIARIAWGDSMNRHIWSFLPFVVGMGLIKLVNQIKISQKKEVL